MDIIEKRSSEGRVKDAFGKILRFAVQLKQSSDNKTINQFSDILDSSNSACFAQLYTDSNLLNQQGIFKKMACQLMGKLKNGFAKLKLNKEFTELADAGVSKKDKIRIMWQNWVNVKRGYFTRWRLNAAKLGISLLRNNLKKDAINKRLMKMILSSAIGK